MHSSFINNNFLTIETDCTQRRCSHLRATNWVECGQCHGWYHCVCENITRRVADVEDYIHICKPVTNNYY